MPQTEWEEMNVLFVFADTVLLLAEDLVFPLPVKQCDTKL